MSRGGITAKPRSITVSHAGLSRVLCVTRPEFPGEVGTTIRVCLRATRLRADTVLPYQRRYVLSLSCDSAWPMPMLTSYSLAPYSYARARTASNTLNFSRKWSTFEALVDIVPWWRLVAEELWQGVRAPLGELSCHQCSTRLRDDEVLHTNPNFACGSTAQVPSVVSGTVLDKSIGANSR